MLETLSHSIHGLLEAVAQLEDDAPGRAELAAIAERGDFRPSEDEAIGFWFARFLTVRQNLWALIGDAQNAVGKPLHAIDEQGELRFLVIGYAAACLLVRIDRLLLFELAEHSLVQRKLNEAFPEYRIPRKQYTRIFSEFVDPIDALALRDAMLFVDEQREQLAHMSSDPYVGGLIERLPELEASLDPSKRAHLKATSEYLSHSVRRRGVVSVERLLAGVLEGFGRAASEFCDREHKAVTSDIREELEDRLLPGDVIVTRHRRALTNLFFPGFWPHAALYVGTAEQRENLGIDVDAERQQRWQGNICVLEALKDGVRLRPLSETLAVDSFVVLRPKIATTHIREAIERAIQHEGKPYNFDFNFFSSDRVVCTEVVYRAYDGLEDIAIPLKERGGRKTLSAEDLLDYALDSGHFTPVALFGTDKHGGPVRYRDLREPLIASYRQT